MLKTASILGSGIMGCDLALLFARHGWQTVVWHRSDAEIARTRWQHRITEYISRGILAPDEEEPLVQRTGFTVSLQRAASADWILETVAEVAAIKRDLLVSLNHHRLPDSILASNTSSVDLESLSSGLRESDSFLGVHFFNPVLRMSLVEVAPVKRTAPASVQRVEQWLVAMGKEPVRVQAQAGLVVNRLMAGFVVQAFNLWEEGVASPADIDRLSAGVLGHPLGPLALADFIGLDVLEAILGNLSEALSDPTLSPPKSLKRLVQQKRLGRKTGVGVFEYPRKSDPQ